MASVQASWQPSLLQPRTRAASKTAVITAPTPIVSITTVISETSTTILTPVRVSIVIGPTEITTVNVQNLVAETKTPVASQTVTVVILQAMYHAAYADNNIFTQVNGQSI
jgi:hypothetical protein